MKISVKTANPARDRSSCLVAAVFEDGTLSPSATALDAACSGQIRKTVKQGDIRGRSGQSLLLQRLPGMTAQRLLLLGAGNQAEFSPAALRRIAGRALQALEDFGISDAVLYLGELECAGLDVAERTRQIVESVHESAYRFDALKSKPSKDRKPPTSLAIGIGERSQLAAARRGLQQGEAIAAGVALARDLGNMPGNVCTPSHLADQALALRSAANGLKVTVYNERQIEKLRMGAFLSVSRGSRQPPRLIVMEHNGGAKAEAPVVLIGKGVTFDSGGISIKPASAMDEMKFDMCGAAAVIGTMKAIAAMALPINVVAVVPASENLPDGLATKPGDIVTSMSGQTIEVLNTDAEGRLLLCDALTFAARFKPAVVIDAATLTGAIVVALGSHAHGLFCADDALAEALLEAGNRSQDRAWRMPLWEDYQSQLDSNFADMANVGGRTAGAVTAACFLWRFARDYTWAHLDIAGAAWNTGKDKGGTGRPVPLLTQYLIDRATSAAGGRRRRRS